MNFGFMSIDISHLFQRFATGEDWLLSIIAAAIILLITYVLKNVIVKLVFKIIAKMTVHSSFAWRDTFISAMKKPIGWSILATGCYLALLILPFQSSVEYLLTKFYKVAFIVIVGSIIYRLEAFYMHVFSNISIKLNQRSSAVLKKFFVKVIRFIIVALTLVMILDVFGFNVSTFIAGLGISGLAFALAAQDTLSNLIAGITLIVDKPFEVGDRIQTNGIDGIVEEISFRTTRLKTINQEYVTIPNNSIAKNPVVNLFRIDHLRNAFIIGCTYNTTTEQLKCLIEDLMAMLNSREDILSDSVSVSLQGFGASSIDVQVVFVTKTGTWVEFIKVRQAINFDIMDTMKKHGIDFAFPSRSLYFETPIVLKNTEVS